MPLDGETVLDCPLRGPVAYPNAQQNDQVLIKTDGFPTYHLANVVDDHLMEITHVIRAEEWIPSTPKHIVLYAAFGWEAPVFVHMPILRNRDRSKISKRRNPTSLDYYKRAGFLPEAMLNFLANLGYSFGDDREKFTLDELIQGFELERISLGGPVFDLDKLDWLNGLYMRDLSHDELLDRVMTEVLSRERLAPIIPLIQERIGRLEDFIPKTEYFFSGALEYDPTLLVPKKLTAEQTTAGLEGAVERLDNVFNWERTTLEEILRAFATETGLKAGPLFMAVRVAVTGRTASPGLFETMEVLGRPICLFRLRDALRKLKELAS
jgi:glutamyl-tRNA synthetase